MGRVGQPRPGPCCSGHLVLRGPVCGDSRTGGPCLSWRGSLRRWDNPGLGCELKVRAWDALVGWSRDLAGLRVWGMSPGSWAGDTGMQGRGLMCSQGVLRGPSRDPKCRQGSLECQAAGLGVAKDCWCRPGLTSMQSKGPGYGQGSWEQNRGPRGAEQGSQQGAGVLAVDQGSHKCSWESWGCRAGSWGTAKGLRGAEPGSWGATGDARGAASGQCRSPVTG